VDNDRSPVSRQIIRDLNAGPHADVKAIDNNLNTSLKRLASAQDYALLYVPTNFEADALRGRQPELRMYYNALFYASG
ncbi:ABC transporter permease, partial [Staphylococcus nepalensis]|nr:ABC transporter permease [Staphylococcus nepalensis]